MNKLTKSIIALFLIASTAFAQDGHDHDKVIPGPKGGKIVEVEGGHAEFFVQPDKKVSVTFYGEDMKPLPPAEQVVTLIAEAPAGKANLKFDKDADAFVSTDVLPEGDGYRVVLQIRNTPDAKPQNFRIEYHTEVCGKCNRAEYACICTGDGHGH
ncbi:MAG: hypothetical protein SFU53_10770 [Terrimicrobiaceae bacterium]|nr:hypothetical protein [Terrimicrobiaceae bacterium]